MRPLIFALILGLTSAVFLAGEARGFRTLPAEGGDCSECHKLSLQEASSLISSMNPSIEVTGVSMSPVEGLWEVVIEARGKKGIAYIDFSKEHVITGSVLKVSTKENLTSLRLYALSKVDLSKIPLDNAIVMGKRDAKYRVVVFDDPD
ncbi:MAG: disulfide isomerase DsbC N-terminal domain-containing protein [Nitrospirota bacterium]